VTATAVQTWTMTLHIHLLKVTKPISFPTPGKIGNDKPSDEENSDKFQGLTNGMKYHEKLVDESSRNILFIGQDRISGLYDTIGILSIDRKNKKLKIIMIPATCISITVPESNTI